MIINNNLFIDILKIIKSDEECIEVEKEFPAEAFLEFDSSLKLLSAVTFKGFIKKELGQIFIGGKLTFSMELTCDRCLNTLDNKFCLPFDDIIAKEDCELEEGEFIPYSNSRVLLTEPIYQAIFVEATGKHLCSDECKGLCPQCGCNLNEQSCNCVTDEIDPRFEKLKNLFNI